MSIVFIKIRLSLILSLSRIIAILFLIIINGYSQNYKIIEVEKKLNDNKNKIISISKTLNINSQILTTIIFTERYLNSNWMDDELDLILINIGFNVSLGFCQIKYSTACWIEEQLNHKQSKYYLGNEAAALIKESNNKPELIAKLNNDSINILYAAAFLLMSIERWKNDGININNNIEILGTLYSNGARKPNTNIRINNFGKKAKEFYLDKRLLKEFK